MITPGTLCRSKDAIVKCDDDVSGRICRVVALVPEHRWRTPHVPEYKVELLAMPVIAFRRQDELDALESRRTESKIEEAMATCLPAS